ncbi:DUF1285 domain-containing protein [Blastochloris sulfoviridis]
MMEPGKPPPPPSDAPAPGGLEALMRSAGAARGLPPLEAWSPPDCGDIDMRIGRDGTWYYQGSPIGRPALVKLFAAILKREGERYVLVTPAEKCGIAVEDSPFLAVEMAVDDANGPRTLVFRTNVDDVVRCGPDHPLRFETGAGGGLKPYLHVRRGLWARLTRPLFYDLVALGEEQPVEGQAMFGIASGGGFFAMARASEIAEPT